MTKKQTSKIRVGIDSKILSISLEHEFVASLKEIAKIEEVTINELCRLIFRVKCTEQGHESAIRSFVCEYYRNMALVFPSEYSEKFRKKIKDK